MLCTLEGRVEDCAVEPRAMTERVVELKQNEILAAVGTATLKVAHEIGNSLNVMSTSVHLIRALFKENPHGVDDGIVTTLREMTSEIEKMKELLGELRDASRPAKVNIQRVSLHEVVSGIIRDRRIATRGTDITVEREIPDDLPPVLADEEKLARVLLNLCLNAFDAMPGGGRLALRAYKADQQVYLEIQDTGVGIAENFDPFRPFNTTKDNGWGLGLAVVSQIIQALNGTISFVSRQGEGTTFRITLPIGT